MRILSIDAWGNKEDGYQWNNWFTVGTIDKATFEKLDTYKKVLVYMRREGYITTGNKRLAYVYDDQYNLVICDKKTDRPLYAIEYGPEY